MTRVARISLKLDSSQAKNKKKVYAEKKFNIAPKQNVGHHQQNKIDSYKKQIYR